MFITHPEHEFPIPRGLANQGSQHWRLVEFVLHVPWFLVTVTASSATNGGMLTHTWCIAWERDLVHLLTSIDTKRIQELVCMMPGWSSRSGQWSSREVREVWLTCTIDAREFLWFIDREGNEFHGGVQAEQMEKVGERRLLLKLKPKAFPLRSKKARVQRSIP